MRARSTCLLLLLAGCDGGGGTDAGPPDTGFVPAVVLTVTRAEAAATVPTEGGGAYAARSGNQFYILDVTLEARTEGPLPIAPNAFTLVLEDSMRSSANPMATNLAADGCVSRSVPVGTSASCRAVFEVVLGAAPPARLEWSDGTRTLDATVPPLEMMMP